MTMRDDLCKHATAKATQAIVDVASLADDARIVMLTASQAVFTAALTASFHHLPRDQRSAIMNEAFKDIFKRVHEQSSRADEIIKEIGL